MNMVMGADKFLSEWVRHLSPTEHHGFGPCTAIGTERDGKLLGAVVYHDYRPHFSSIQMSCAAVDRRWLSRAALEIFFHYPFVQLRCERVTAIVARKNKPSRSLVEGVGFCHEGVVRKGFGTDDAMIYGMLKNECRWLKETRHERLAISTART